MGYTTARTYAEMLRQAAPFLDEGKPVILGASYLRRQLREEARAFAERAGVRFVAIECVADESLVRDAATPQRRLEPVRRPMGGVPGATREGGAAVGACG